VAAVEPPHTFQLIAWQAAIIGSIIGSILGVIQLIFSLLKQHRDTRIERAKFGYELLDEVLKNEWSSELLNALDSSLQDRGRRKSKMTHLADDFARWFRDKESLPKDRKDDVFTHLDWLLYFYDRFEHAIEGGLTTFDNVRTPTAYYVGILAKYKPGLVPYIKEVGYSRVLTFLDRFRKEWHDV
jgi:hypothetical protein